MNTSVKRTKDNVVLTITITPEEVDAAIKQAYKEAAKKYKFPGFRPGKAPRKVIDNAFGGSEVIIGDATETLINDTFPRALDEQDMRPLGSTTFGSVPASEEGKIPPIEEGKEFAYTAEFQVRPELELKSTDPIEIEMATTDATDDEINEQLAAIQEQYAALEPVEGRPVKADDFALISFVADVDGEPYENNEVDKFLYEMGRGNMPPAFDEGLIGMNAGDEKRIEFEIPAGEDNDEFSGKTAGFDVTVHEIKEKQLGDLDDEFAKSLGLDSLDQLKKEIASQITSQKEQMGGRVKEKKAVTELAERLKGDVPEVLIEEKTDELLKDFYRTLQQREMDPGEYMASQNTTAEGLREDMKVQAEEIVKEELALEALFRAQGMELTDADIDDEFRMAAGEKGDPTKLRKEWEAAGLMPMLREGTRRVKAVRWLMDNVKINEPKPTKKGKKSDDKAEKKSASKKKA